MKFLVDFKNTVDQDQIDQYFKDYSLTVVSTFNSFDKVFLVEGSAIPPLTDIIETVVEDDVNPVVPLSYETTSDNLFPTVEYNTFSDVDWWKVAVQISPNFEKETQTVPRKGQSAVVYVVDSGIKLDHSEFEFATVSNLFSFNDDYTDYNGHGTAIASLLCGKTCAISDPIVKSVKIFQKGVSTYRSDILRAFDAIIADMPTTPDKFHVVNMSWGVDRDLYLESRIRDLINSGVWVVAAAGNGGTTIENITPACMPELFTVGAFDTNLHPCDFSNYTGPVVTTNGVVNSGELDVWAPGAEIKVATLDGDYDIVGGTSMAAAIHSAAIAYNSHIYCFEDDTAAPMPIESKLLSRISYGKPELIIKDDKYKNSSIYCTVFLTQNDGDYVNYTTIANTQYVVDSGKELSLLLAGSYRIKEIKIAKQLPLGLRLEGLWLRGIPEVDDWHIFETKITYIKYNGMELQRTLQLFFTPQDPQSYSEDEIKNIFPYLNGCGEGGTRSCDGNCFFGICVDACAGKPNEIFCYCDPPSQICPF
jgi:subtilisin family serine protease